MALNISEVLGYLTYSFKVVFRHSTREILDAMAFNAQGINAALSKPPLSCSLPCYNQRVCQFRCGDSHLSSPRGNAAGVEYWTTVVGEVTARSLAAKYQRAFSISRKCELTVKTVAVVTVEEQTRLEL